jgi:hypothetical protein
MENERLHQERDSSSSKEKGEIGSQVSLAFRPLTHRLFFKKWFWLIVMNGGKKNIATTP